MPRISDAPLPETVQKIWRTRAPSNPHPDEDGLDQVRAWHVGVGGDAEIDQTVIKGIFLGHHPADAMATALM